MERKLRKKKTYKVKSNILFLFTHSNLLQFIVDIIYLIESYGCLSMSYFRSKFSFDLVFVWVFLSVGFASIITFYCTTLKSAVFFLLVSSTRFEFPFNFFLFFLCFCHRLIVTYDCVIVDTTEFLFRLD